MFGKLKRTLEERKQRINEESERRKVLEAEQKEKQRQKEYEDMQLISREVDKYLKAINVPFVLVPEVSEGLLSILKARSTGEGQINFRLTEELFENLMAFYNDNFNIFLSMLEKKGISLQGRESQFLDMFLSRMEENNYNRYFLKYGDFASDKDNFKEIVYEYFEVSDEDDVFEVGALLFLEKYLRNKGIFNLGSDTWHFFDKVEEAKKTYEMDCKINKMEKRLELE